MATYPKRKSCERAKYTRRIKFNKPFLIALQELTLREIADHLEEVAIATTSAGEVCNIQERVLVGFSTYLNS